MLNAMAVMIGGGIGAGLRYGLFLFVQRVSGVAFPFGTLVVNLLGSFFIGYLWSLFEGAHFVHEWRLFVFTGLLGGFTTFSTFTREAVQLFQTGEWKAAVTYILLSNIFGVMFVLVGFFSYKLFPVIAR